VIDIDDLAGLARLAGEAILEIYRTEFHVEEKADFSPLTLADQKSHEIISGGLRARYPSIPILSEEGSQAPFEVRRSWSHFWLVDPLDGTKEFVKRNGEFTVNIALVEGTRPIVGIIYLPVTGALYAAMEGEGAWRIESDGRHPISVAKPGAQGPIRVLKSRSHASPQMDAVLDLFPSVEVVTRGSALKFCALACGEADFYPRSAGTWEWDTAAGQAIVAAAGGVLVDPLGNPFTYNKPNLRNGPFLAAPSLEWLKRSGVFQRMPAFKLE
jgi:3'(2'), 5'-bisphosphate nucleotidase